MIGLHSMLLLSRMYQHVALQIKRVWGKLSVSICVSWLLLRVSSYLLFDVGRAVLKWVLRGSDTMRLGGSWVSLDELKLIINLIVAMGYAANTATHPYSASTLTLQEKLPILKWKSRELCCLRQWTRILVDSDRRTSGRGIWEMLSIEVCCNQVGDC